MKLSALVDWFIPKDLTDHILKYTRARILVGVGLLYCLILIGNASRAFSLGEPIVGAAVAIVGIIMFACLIILKSTGSLVLSSTIFIASYYFILFFTSYQAGGSLSPIQYNCVNLIIVSFLLSGLRGGLFWGGLTLASVVFLKILEVSGHQFPPLRDDGLFMNVMVILIVVIYLISFYETSSISNLKKFATERDKSNQTSRSIKKLLDDVKKTMAQVSEGNLTQKITAETEGDLKEMKESVNNALEMLSQTINQVDHAARKIDSGSSEVSSAAQSIATGTTEQAASLEEISSTMNEIGSKAKTNRENASQAKNLSTQTLEEVNRSNAQMESMLESMNQINSTSSDVSKVIKVIDEIAFQTNLLALNAAVEAARAGKYGKGFAVVAEEVRNLAARSAEAAKSTTELIENSIKEVSQGVEKADQTANMLKGFVTSIEKVNDIVGEISAASEEQEAGASEINTSLEQVNNVVQQNSSVSEETASSSEELSSQAELLIKLMSKFSLGQNTFKEEMPQVLDRKIKHQDKGAPKLVHVEAPSSTDPQAKKQIILDDNDFGKY